VPAKERDLGLANHEPSILRYIVLANEEPARALEPSRRDGEIATKGEVVPNEPDRDARRATRVVPFAIQRVGALARVEGERGFVEPPRGEAEVLEGLRRFSLADARGEVCTSFVPRAARESRLGG
jgi:hypothetical protein